MIKQRLLSKYEPKQTDDGKVFWYKPGEKEPLLDKSGHAKTPAHILDEDFAARFVPKGAQQNGAGGLGGDTGGTALTKADVHKQLEAKGLKPGNPDYIKEFEKITTDNKISV